MDLRHVLQYDLRRIRQRGTLIASILFGFWAVSFGLRLFLPQIRPGWSRTWLAVLTGLYTGGIILNAVSEWFFWSEFGVRYNFIAVDYLVYTNGSGRQHHGVLSGRSALRRRAAADRRMHLAAVQTGDPPCRRVRHLAMESGRIARLPAAHPGLLPAPAVQHPIPAKRQHLCQTSLQANRSLQVYDDI